MPQSFDSGKPGPWGRMVLTGHLHRQAVIESRCSVITHIGMEPPGQPCPLAERQPLATLALSHLPAEKGVTADG